jgi:HK97 family phage major capsid protein
VSDKVEETATIPQSLDDLRGRTPEELYALCERLEGTIRELHQTNTGEIRDLTSAEEGALKLAVEMRSAAMKKLEEHRAIADTLRVRPKAAVNIYAGLTHGEEFGSVRSLPVREARDRALRVLDSVDAAHLKGDQKDEVNSRLRSMGGAADDLARRILVTENDGYRSAWMKAVTDPNWFARLTDDERDAMKIYEEYRAMSEGTTSAGGFGIPVFIDPSIILTAQGTGNPFLELAQQATVNTNAWKGVSSAGVTWAFQAEAAAATDNSPTLAQPTVTVYMARGFIPYSIEVGQDYPDFANQMATLLAAGYDEILVDKFTRGTGSGEPQGILTALSANTNTRVALTTSGTFGAPDPYKVWGALPQRFRRNANWLMSVVTNNAFRQLGTANVYHAYTVNLPEGWTDALFRRGVYESPYMPDVTTSTSATIGLAVVGDFSNYLIARRGGMSVELVPQLFDVTNNRPTGQRGWFAYARIGGGSINDLGFRLLVNT